MLVRRSRCLSAWCSRREPSSPPCAQDQALAAHFNLSCFAVHREVLFLYSRYSVRRECGTGPRVCIKQNAKPAVLAAQTLPAALCVRLSYNSSLSF